MAGEKGAGIAIGGGGLFPLLFPFLFFLPFFLESLGRCRRKALAAKSPVFGDKLPLADLRGVAEIAVVRRMRMRGSVMGFGLLLVEKGRLEI